MCRRHRKIDFHQRLRWFHADQQVRPSGRRTAKINPVALGQVLTGPAGACGLGLLPVARPAVVLIEVFQDGPRELERLTVVRPGLWPTTTASRKAAIACVTACFASLDFRLRRAISAARST